MSKENKNQRMINWCKEPITLDRSLFTIVINICDVCNRKCSFCPRGYGYTPPGDKYISLNTITMLCKQLKDYKGNFSLSGFGEPFLHPQLQDILNTFKEYHPNSFTYITTNGDFLKPIENVDRIDISVYDEDKIYNLDPNINYNFKYLKDSNFNNRAGNAGPVTNKLDCCNIPMYRLNMDLNGDFLICCSDWRREVVLGNVYKDNIYDVWINKLKDLRLNLINNRRDLCNLCKKCDVKGNLNGDEFKQFWKQYYKKKS